MIPNDLAHRAMASSAAKSSSSTPPRGRAPRRRPDSFDAVKAVVLGHGARAARRRGTYEAPVEVLPVVAAVHATTTTTTRDGVKKRRATTEPEAASGHAKKRAVVPAHDDVSATVSRGRAGRRPQEPARPRRAAPRTPAAQPRRVPTRRRRTHALLHELPTRTRARARRAARTAGTRDGHVAVRAHGRDPPAKLPVDAKTAAEVLLATVCGEELPLAASAEAKALARFAMAGAEVGIRATKIPAVAGRRAKELTRANAKLKCLMDEET